MGTFLERYRAGERREVWAELIAMGSRVRDQSVLQDALAVAHETMSRAAENVEILFQRLTEMGYWFRAGDRACQRPDSNTKASVWEAEQKAGPLPISLRACFIEIGEVDFCWQHPDWPATYAIEPVDYSKHYVYADPLCVSPASHLLFNIGEWEQEDAVWRKQNPVLFDLAPDEVRKADFSGGPPYVIELPNDGADPFLKWVNQRPGIRLVDYLRVSFSWGGFPGFEFEPSYPAEIDELKADLLPI